MTVQNEDLIITSTFVSVASIAAIAENLAYADLNPFYATLNVTQQPALVYAYFTCTSSRTNSTWDFVQAQILIDGVVSGGDGYTTDGDQATTDYWLSAVGCLRVTTTGSKVIKVQQRHWGNAEFKNNVFSVFWIPCSP